MASQNDKKNGNRVPQQPQQYPHSSVSGYGGPTPYGYPHSSMIGPPPPMAAAPFNYGPPFAQAGYVHYPQQFQHAPPPFAMGQSSNYHSSYNTQTPTPYHQLPGNTQAAPGTFSMASAKAPLSGRSKTGKTPKSALKQAPQQSAAHGSSSQPTAASHRRHQGKNPPSRKKRRGRPRTTVTKSSSKSQQRNSSSKPRGPIVEIIDEDVNRLVNPLVELPKEQPGGDPVHGSELIRLTDLVYYPPDTYPLSYLGRLLGFDIPVPSQGDGDDAPAFPTPMNIEQLSFIDRKMDVFYQIPELGARMQNRCRLSGLGDGDDQCTLDRVDPVYTHFLEHGFEPSRCKSGTPNLVSKLTASQAQLSERRIKATELAETLELPLEDWSFDQWTTIASKHLSRRPQWSLDGRACAAPTSQTFGVVASYQSCPIYLIHYKFQWYKMPENRESELIMVLEGITKRSGTEVVAAVVAPEEGSRKPEDGSDSEDFMLSSDKDDCDQDFTNEAKPAEKESVNPKVEGTTTVNEPYAFPDVNLPDPVRLMLLALALEHARAADVWYGLWNVPVELVAMSQQCFRMVPLSRQAAYGIAGPTSMICDLKKCSTRYALLKYKEEIRTSISSDTKENDEIEFVFEQRALVKMPLLEEAKSCFDAEFAENQRSKRSSTSTNAKSISFTGASGKFRDVVVGIRAIVDNTDHAKLQTLSTDPAAKTEPIVLHGISKGQTLPTMDILRRFPLPDETKADKGDDEILRELMAKQSFLSKADSSMEPHLRELMQKTIDLRMDFEKSDARKRRAEECRILKEHEDYVARRKELHQAREEQREQDMNAVCSICNDGEVTPENQILFCEACDVPIHQFCYGIEQIPEGDYYCVACRHFNREKMSKENERINSTGGRIALPPLPIRCELCPVKEGAFVRTDTSKTEANKIKWVHVACAKWQGLSFVNPDNPQEEVTDNAEMVEDVTLLKQHFRRMDIRCEICQGKRGAFHKCRHEGCDKYLHPLCARAIGVCEVIHGDCCEGPVAVNPWTLMCPEHSQIDPDKVPENPISVESLIEMAKELPDDPMPEPIPEPHKPFNKLNGKERRKALSDPEYERELFEDFMTKRVSGARCEVCGGKEEECRGLARCSDCLSVICCECRLSDKGEINPEQRYFRCLSCRFVREKIRVKEEFETPQCQMCNQNHGLLLESVAHPVNRKTYWKSHEKEFQKSIFGRQSWSHYVCTFWLQRNGLQLKGEVVDCSNVVLSNGSGFVKQKNVCSLCGLTTGMKVPCGDENCRARGEKRQCYMFHVTCARQAGLEVQYDDEHDPDFYVKCYFHGGCEYNLRAQLEDLLEIEKRRAGVTYSRSEAPMKFSDGARILNQAIIIMRMLGWAWRWAEQWVDWGSNWEPLLEAGKKEEEMTKKQLKIIESTQESRAQDARFCRLAAFGAALRNRAYDLSGGGFDNESLGRALNAILHTKSLVGPLKSYEIAFCTDWLSRAYRSKSKFLGFGEDKIRVAKNGFCVHQRDKSPKYELGKRPIPGKEPLPNDNQVYESIVDEPDDFLLPELFSDGTKCTLPPHGIKPMKRKELKYKKSKSDEDEEEELSTSNTLEGKASSVDNSAVETPKRKSGRPRKDEAELTSRSDSVAAIAPSAVKRRGPRERPFQEDILEKPRTSGAEIGTPFSKRPKINKSSPIPPMVKKLFLSKKEKRVPALDAAVVYQDLVDADNEDSVLRKLGRKGRPPKIIDYQTYVVVDGCDFLLGEQRSNHDENSVESHGTAGVRSLAIKTPRKVPVGKVDASDAGGVGLSVSPNAESLDDQEKGAGQSPQASDDESRIAEADIPSPGPMPEDSPAPPEPSGPSRPPKKSRKATTKEMQTEKIETVEKSAEKAENKQRQPKLKKKRALTGLYFTEITKDRVRQAPRVFSPSHSTVKSYDSDDKKTQLPRRKRRRGNESDSNAEHVAPDYKHPSSSTSSHDGGSSSDEPPKQQQRGPGRRPKESAIAPSPSPKRRGRPPKKPRIETEAKPEDEDVEEDVITLSETLTPIDQEMHVTRGKGRKPIRSPRSPLPTKRELRSSARSPGRPLFEDI